MIDLNHARNLAPRPRAGGFLTLTGRVFGKKPVLALLIPLLWTAALALPVFGAQGGAVLTSLHSFSVFSNGEHSLAGLVQGRDGNFYGTTFGTYLSTSAGTVFQINTNGALNTLHSFTNGTDGANPGAGLVQGSDGNLYGTTVYGGTNNSGTVFKITTNGVLTSLHSFTGNDGSNPRVGLVQGSDGYLYGVAGGGTNGSGMVYKINPNGALTSLYSFTGGTDGSGPNLLLQASDGDFYGTAEGGMNNSGTVFKVDPNGALTTLYSFTGGNDGANPNGLVQGGDGRLYGTTTGGGAGGAGTVFRLTVVSAAPVFQAVTLINGVLSMTWSTEPGGSYLVQYNLSDLSPNNWSNFGNPVIAGGATLTFTDDNTQPQRKSYRVKRLP